MDRTQKTEIVNMCMVCKDGLVLVEPFSNMAIKLKKRK